MERTDLPVVEQLPSGKLAIELAPGALIEARESIGLTQIRAARELKLFAADLRLYEEENEFVPLDLLWDMADLYKVPETALLRNEAVTPDAPLVDFRQKATARSRPWSYELHSAHLRIEDQRQALIYLAELTETDPESIDLKLSADRDPEVASRLVRSWLGLDEFFPAPFDSYEAFNAWVVRVERRPIYVTQIQGVLLTEMRGLSVSERPFPFIAINSRDWPRGKTFTLLHELVHVLLNTNSLCDLADDRRPPDTATASVEAWCNQVAAATLIPLSDLMQHPMVQQATYRSRWTARDLEALSKRYGASEEAVLLRLVGIEKASRAFYDERREDIYEALGTSSRPKTLGGNYYDNQIRYYGRRYLRSVLAAYRSDELTPIEAYRFTGVKIKNLENLVDRLGTEP